MHKNLVVARVGEKSLHRGWLQNAKPDFDMVLLFYGAQVPDAWAADGLETYLVPGSKWQGISRYLEVTSSWRDYDRVFFPDDDLVFDARALNDFFEITYKMGADLSQPALDARSYFAHPITLRSPSFIARFTTFVELMCPCFSKRFLPITAPYFKETESCFGLDFYWAKLLRENGMTPPVIVDHVSVTHTRPVGSAGSGCTSGHNPDEDWRQFLTKYQITLSEPSVVGGFVNNELLTMREHSLPLKLKLVQDVFAMTNMPDAQKFRFIAHLMAQT